MQLKFSLPVIALALGIILGVFLLSKDSPSPQLNPNGLTDEEQEIHAMMVMSCGQTAEACTEPLEDAAYAMMPAVPVAGSCQPFTTEDYEGQVCLKQQAPPPPTSTTVPPPTSTTAPPPTSTTAPPPTATTSPPPSGSCTSANNCTLITNGNNFTATVSADQVWECAPGVILDGNFSQDYAFRGDADNVTIRNCIIQEYGSPSQRAAIDNCSGGAGRGEGWTLDNLTLRWNESVGVYLGTNGVLKNSTIEYNGQAGVKACGSNGLVENNTIRYNNAQCPNGSSRPGGAGGCTSWGWEGGGSKFVATNGLRIADNTVFGNCGPGLWLDIDNRNSLVEGNTVFGNSASGIFSEIGFSATIRNNDVRNDGLTITVPAPSFRSNVSSRTCSGGGGAWGGAEITINNSLDNVVTGNYVDAPSGRAGIRVVQQNRTEHSHHAALSQRVTVTGNNGPDGGCYHRNVDYQSNLYSVTGTRC